MDNMMALEGLHKQARGAEASLKRQTFACIKISIKIVAVRIVCPRWRNCYKK